MRKVMRRFLDATGYVIFEAGDGEEALRIAARERPDVILLDRQIPRVDGYGVVTETLDRSELRAVQTPQGFRRDVLAAAHAAQRTQDVTDDAALVEAMGIKVQTVAGDERAFKVTTSWDLAVAESLWRSGNQ